MSSRKLSLNHNKEIGIAFVAMLITVTMYVGAVCVASTPHHAVDFLLVEPGTTAKIFEFYSSNLRASFFTGFLALGGFLMSAKTFIIVNMKKEVFDTAGYEKEWRDSYKLSGPGKSVPLFYPLRRLSNILFYTISCSFITSVSQLTLGLFSTIFTTFVCIFFVVVTLLFLTLTLFLIKKNLATMFNHLDQVAIQKAEKALEEEASEASSKDG